MPFCSRCRKQLGNNDRFCSSCGTPVYKYTTAMPIARYINRPIQYRLIPTVIQDIENPKDNGINNQPVQTERGKILEKSKKLDSAVAGGNADKKVGLPKNEIEEKTKEIISKLQKSSNNASNSKHGRLLVAKVMTYSLGSILGFFPGRTSITAFSDELCRVVDLEGNLKYITDPIGEKMFLYDSNSEKIGYIKEHLFSVGMPFEKDVKKYSVYLGKNKLCVLKKSVFCGDKTIEVLEGNIEISHNKGESFQINFKERLFAKIYELPAKLKGGYHDRYVIDCKEPSNEAVAILIIMALDQLGL